MTVVIQRRHLVAGTALATATALLAYIALASSDEPDRTARPTISPGPADIVNLLPVDRDGIAAAAHTAQQFIAAYGSYRYDEAPSTYLAQLRPLAADDLYKQLVRSANDTAVLTARKQFQMTVTADARVTAIRDLQAGSIIFTVVGHQRITRSGQQTQDDATFSVTVGPSTGKQQTSDNALHTPQSWQVLTLAPADTGQIGDASP